MRHGASLNAAYSIDVPSDLLVRPDFLVVADRVGPRSQRLSVAVEGQTWVIELVPERNLWQSGLSRIVPTSDPFVFCAIVSGSVFVVDVRSPAAAFYEAGVGTVTDVAIAELQGLVVFATDWDVSALKGSQIIWRSRRIAVEGVRFDRVDRGRVVGAVDEASGEARDFSIDLCDGPSRAGFRSKRRQIQ